MKNAIPEFDAYIERAEPFARPILTHVRELFHEVYPDIGEAMKWSSPCFMHHGIVAGISAFKKHVRLGFWRGAELSDPRGYWTPMGTTGVASRNLESLGDLPPKRALVATIRAAVKLNEERATKPAVRKATRKKKAAPRGEAKVPEDLMAALKKKRVALATFEGFSPSNRREYVEWVTEAKREATRAKRIAQAVEWMAEGKPRNWKYMEKW